jgi:hypothetical protein
MTEATRTAKLVWGEPGTGKSEMVRRVMEAQADAEAVAKVPLIDVRLSKMDPETLAAACPAVPVIATEAKDHILHAAFKSGNGRRVTHDFPITEFQANDTAARASAISNASAYGFGRGYKMLVNWTIKKAK